MRLFVCVCVSICVFWQRHFTHPIKPHKMCVLPIFIAKWQCPLQSPYYHRLSHTTWCANDSRFIRIAFCVDGRYDGVMMMVRWCWCWWVGMMMGTVAVMAMACMYDWYDVDRTPTMTWCVMLYAAHAWFADTTSQVRRIVWLPYIWKDRRLANVCQSIDVE